MNLKLHFTNFEENTKQYLQKLKEIQFEKIEIDERDALSFVEIEDKNFLCFVSKLVIEDKVQYGLRIFKNSLEYKFHIDIPLYVIDMISKM